MSDSDRSAAFLSGGGIAGALARSIDWSASPLGPIASWPSSLKTTIGTILHSHHPMFLWWGPELIQFYNDGYLPSFGVGKHPAAMGQRGSDCWQEIWPIIWPQIEDVMNRGKASWNEDALVPILRNERIEEVYWTYGYSPVFDEAGRVGGTLVVCTETTKRVLSERRLWVLRALAEKTALAVDTSGVLRGATAVFEEGAHDIPFALIYVRDPKSGAVTLVESAGLSAEALTKVASLLEPRVLAFGGRERLGDEASLELAGLNLPGGPWPEPTLLAFIEPLVKSSGRGASGFIVFGLSPRLSFDGAYRDYLRQLAEHVALASARVEAFRIRALAESERNNLLLQAPVATAVFTGKNHVFQLANPRYCQMVGRFDLVGRTYLEVFPEVKGTELPRILDRVYETGEAFVSEEYLVALDRGDGTLEHHFFKFNLEAMRDIDSAVYGMMVVALDITEQVSARRVLEKTSAEREKLLFELEAASRAKDEFLAMLGHELRNPLSPIVMALELMKLRGNADSSRERQIIERQVNHLVRLVDDLLDVSKITRGEVELRIEVVEIADVLARAAEIASFLLERRRHRLTIDVPASGLRWAGDPVRLAQVVGNLLTNAARYTSIGGSISLAAAREGEEIVIRVRDNGIGIQPEMLPRIFELFVQGTRRADRAEGGLGIGLAIVKNLVAMHGGTVTASSAGLGQGSEFVIRLPTLGAVGTRHALPALPADGWLRASPHPTRVLVVDDNVDAAEMLGEALRLVGHEVSVVNDPLRALAVLEAFRPKVAILDIGLPGMDGYELGARIRSTLAATECRLIALTGYGQKEDRARSAQANFQGHLVKPVDIEQLIRLVADG